jgi:dual specificity protein phosphatase 1B
MSHLKYEFVDPPGSIYKIRPNLFVGGFGASTNAAVLKKHKITHVINCAIEKQIKLMDGITIFNFKIDDRENFPIGKVFEQTSNTIDYILKDPKNKVLVSCAMGINRSMSVIVAYLIKKTKKDINDIIAGILKTRPFAMLTNRSFYDQLVNFQKKHLK